MSPMNEPESLEQKEITDAITAIQAEPDHPAFRVGLILNLRLSEKILYQLEQNGPSNDKDLTVRQMVYRIFYHCPLAAALCFAVYVVAKALNVPLWP